MEFKNKIKEQLRENRPNLSEKSLATYTSTLYNLPLKVLGENQPVTMDFFKDTDRIMKYLKDTAPNKRKSILGAVFVLTNNEKARELMIGDSKIVNEHYKQQKKSDKEVENWIDWQDILNIYNAKLRISNLIFKKKVITPEDINILNDFIILSCYVLMPPRRLMDYAEMKVKNFDENKDNCIKGKNIISNNYKTLKTYGKQTFTMPQEFASLVKKWMKINESDYLIYHKKGSETSVSNLNKQINSIFDGKKISVDMIRHSFLTNYYSGKMPTLVEMEEMSKKMAHSVTTALTYIKQN